MAEPESSSLEPNPAYARRRVRHRPPTMDSAVSAVPPLSNEAMNQRMADIEFRAGLVKELNTNPLAIWGYEKVREKTGGDVSQVIKYLMSNVETGEVRGDDPDPKKAIFGTNVRGRIRHDLDIRVQATDRVDKFKETAFERGDFDLLLKAQDQGGGDQVLAHELGHLALQELWEQGEADELKDIVEEDVIEVMDFLRYADIYGDVNPPSAWAKWSGRGDMTQYEVYDKGRANYPKVAMAILTQKPLWLSTRGHDQFDETISLTSYEQRLADLVIKVNKATARKLTEMGIRTEFPTPLSSNSLSAIDKYMINSMINRKSTQMIDPRSHVPSTNGLQSYAEASPDYELAPIGIASMRDQVQRLAEFGRNGDVYVIHAAEGETVIPMEVLEANPQIKTLLFNQMAEMGLDPQRYIVGDQLNSLNPATGMPEFFFSSVFKSVKKAVKKVVKFAKLIAPIAIPLAAAAFGFPMFMGAMFAQGTIGAAMLGSGIGSLIGGASIKDSIKQSLIAGATAGVFAGAQGFAAAPAGQGMAGFGAGVKASITGMTPVYGAATAGGAGELLGYQRATSFGDSFSNMFGGKTPGQFTPLASAEYPTNVTNFAGTPPVTPGSTGGTLAGSGYTSRIPVTPGTSQSPILTSTAVESGFGLAPIDPVIGRPVGSTTAFRGGTRPVVAQGPVADPSITSVALGIPEGGTQVAANPDLFLGPLSPSKYLGIPEGGSNVVDLGLGLGGTYLGGGFDTAEEEEITQADMPDIGGARLTDEERRRMAEEAELSARALDPYHFTPNPDVMLTSAAPFWNSQAAFNPIGQAQAAVPQMLLNSVLQPHLFGAAGGSVNYPERDLLVEGPGTERSDNIPAMLSDGEFVLNSRAVRGADPSGRGNRYAGAQNLYNLMRNFEMRA